MHSESLATIMIAVKAAFVRCAGVFVARGCTVAPLFKRSIPSEINQYSDNKYFDQ